MSDDTTLYRKALGRGALLGDLYDARKDEFCGVSLFKDKIPEDLTSSVDVPNTRFDFDFSDSYEEKFSKLDVEAELKISVMAGLFKLEGSAKYLSSEKKNYKSVKGNMIYDIRTKDESFSISNEKLKEILSHDALRLDATHVVVGIKWGANVIASFEYENNDFEEKKNIEGALHASFTKATLSITGSASVKFTEEEKKLHSKLMIRFHGDVIAQDDELPQTYEKALELMKKVPSYVKCFNKGKGKPLEYVLYPIKNVEKFFQLESAIDRLLTNLNVETISRLEKEFDDLLVAKQKLNDLKDELEKNSDFIDDKHLNEVSSRIKEIKIQEAKFRESVAQKLVLVRSGKEPVSCIEELIQTLNESICGPSELINFVNQYTTVQNKLRKIKEFLNANITYVSKKDSVEILPIRSDTKDVYIFYFNDELDKTEAYVESKKFFMRLVKDVEKESKFFIVDFDIHPEVDKNIGVKIYFYSNGNLIDEDFYANRKERLKWCVVKSAVVSRALRKPQAAKVIKLPCPGIKTACPLDKYEWNCDRCEQLIEYGFDNNFYCDCGGAPIESYTFKCKNPRHPNEFVALNKPDFESYFEQKSNEINILLLGETGVGKSTFINGLLNYLFYSSMEEAKSNELKYAISAQFVVTDECKVLRTINVGSDPNESTNVGQSATQNATAHVFHIDDMTLRIIDTPGIGDTRGIEVDKQNFQNILDYISHYSHLNAICILLKPNNARLDLAFRFCIKELLTHLHKNAKDNIVFCFSNSRGTFYRPGDTMPALQKLLSDLEQHSKIKVPLDKNVFCFDNESFRFLAAVKQGIEFEEEDQEQFSQSWNRSVKEAQNLMRYISQCPIHKIKETVTLNESRQLIMEMSKPLAEISQLIQINIQKAEDDKKDLQTNNYSIEELQSKLKIQQFDLEPTPLNYPRTVCTQTSCTKVLNFNGIGKTDYVTHCHPHCGIEGVPTDSLNNVALQNCAAMYNGTCTVCGHHWSVHMHITYENKPVEKFVEDPNVKNLMIEKMSRAEIIEKKMKDSNTLLVELKEEQKIITDTSAKFAHFTKVNAIAVFNDDLENYLDHMIKEEQGKKNAGYNNDSVIDGLMKTKNGYKEQQKIFNEAIGTDSYQNVQLDEIKPMIESLYNLKHNGATLKKLVNAKKNGLSSTFHFAEKKHDVEKKKSTSGGFVSQLGKKFMSFFS